MRLSYVVVTDEDYRIIYISMKKCSKWMFGHDKSQAIDVNRPNPDELQQDIASLRNFAKIVNSRCDAIRKQRQSILEPEKPSSG